MKDPHALRRWRDHTAPLVISKNPLCQFIDSQTGQQCRYPSTIVHHLADWKQRPDLFFEWSNLVAVCKQHHPGGQAGENPAAPAQYVATIGVMNLVFDHGCGMPDWHHDAKPRTPAAPPVTGPLVMTGDVGRQWTSSSNQAAINRALEADENEPA